MKTALIAILATLALSSDALALAGCAPGTPTKIATGPNGKPLEVCLDGKWKTCYRDSQRIGRHTRGSQALLRQQEFTEMILTASSRA
jgi:hypothetical protein